ncbi:YdcH family protein [Thalassotalea fonticola]|uniref:YdcH family protein n=1 Tax=Thalassotalea fonticola TaxID=3065649 RepID=A0ABZ0GLF4_9GAMM|nr:YdcH family protein [Colwelliaceae bacterium S1-1]
MNIQKHDLHHEFPEFRDEIRTLKMNNNHFAKVFKEYHELDHEVIRIEEGVENTTDEYLDELKMQRLNHKDELFLMLKKHQAKLAQSI